MSRTKTMARPELEARPSPVRQEVPRRRWSFFRSREPVPPQPRLDSLAGERPASGREIEMMHDLALRWQHVGRFDAALRVADGITVIAPRDARGFALRGAVLERMGDRESAREALDEAVQRSPLDLELVFALGRLCVLCGDERRGLRELRRAQILAEARHDHAFAARAKATIDAFAVRMPQRG